jgi:ABC-2 type transport system ATP-binding protein
MATAAPALEVIDVRHRYGDRVALDGVSFTVSPGEIFGLLGPNGGGKTTLFKIASTLMTATSGTVRVLGADVRTDPNAARKRLGVVFQSAAVDIRLTVAENLRHHGHLYGLRGHELATRLESALDRVRLRDRVRDLVSTLSGGLRRRVEIAKSLMHRPDLLLLDEPSTGLDPSARRDIWQDLQRLRTDRGTTVVMTTHLMDEAAACDRVAIVDSGRLVRIGTPAQLTSAIGGDVIVITTRDAEALLVRIRDRFGVQGDLVDGRVRLEKARGHEFITDLVEAFPGDIDAVSFGKPTLDDVFVDATGRRME